MFCLLDSKNNVRYIKLTNNGIVFDQSNLFKGNYKLDSYIYSIYNNKDKYQSVMLAIADKINDNIKYDISKSGMVEEDEIAKIASLLSYRLAILLNEALNAPIDITYIKDELKDYIIDKFYGMFILQYTNVHDRNDREVKDEDAHETAYSMFII